MDVNDQCHRRWILSLFCLLATGVLSSCKTGVQSQRQASQADRDKLVTDASQAATTFRQETIPEDKNQQLFYLTASSLEQPMNS